MRCLNDGRGFGWVALMTKRCGNTTYMIIYIYIYIYIYIWIRHVYIRQYGKCPLGLKGLRKSKTRLSNQRSNPKVNSIILQEPIVTVNVTRHASSSSRTWTGCEWHPAGNEAGCYQAHLLPQTPATQRVAEQDVIQIHYNSY